MELSTEISGKGLLHSYQQASFLMTHQTNHRTHMFLSYKMDSYMYHESDYEINSVPLNILTNFKNATLG